MEKYKLYAVPTWGSAIVELVLQHSNFTFDVEYLSPKDVGSPAYKKVNPLAQIPTLILPNGETLTECLAICYYLEAKGQLGLTPKVDAPEYPRFLRWSVFLSSLYAMAPFADHPDWFVTDAKAQKELHEESLTKIKERFLILELESSAPYFLGKDPTLIDMILTVMTFWDPGREWFEDHCPKIISSVNRIQATKQFQAVYEKNNPDSRP